MNEVEVRKAGGVSVGVRAVVAGMEGRRVATIGTLWRRARGDEGSGSSIRGSKII